MPVNSSIGLWGFNWTSFAIGDQDATPEIIHAFIDTGYTYMTRPSTVLEVYFAEVSGSSFDKPNNIYDYPCSAELPTLTLGLGDNELEFPGRAFNVTSDGHCHSALRPAAKGDSLLTDSLVVIGGPVLESLFVVFDFGETLQLGFASQADLQNH